MWCLRLSSFFVFLFCLFSALVCTARCLSRSPSFVLAEALHVGFFFFLLFLWLFVIFFSGPAFDIWPCGYAVSSVFLVHDVASWSCRLDLFCKSHLSECCLPVAETWEGYVRCDISQNKKSILPVAHVHRLMASNISVCGKPECVNLIVRALAPDYLLLDIFLHLRSETWTQWTIEAARVKGHHRPFFLKMVLWCIRLMRLTLFCEVVRYRLVKKKCKSDKISKKKNHPGKSRLKCIRAGSHCVWLKRTLIFTWLRFDRISEILLPLAKMTLWVFDFRHELSEPTTGSHFHNVGFQKLFSWSVSSPLVLSSQCRRPNLWESEERITFRFAKKECISEIAFGCVYVCGNLPPPPPRPPFFF